jgi:glucose/arabinose dehydrogenase
VPWGIAFLPDGTALVGERDTARVLLLGSGARREIGTVPGVVSGVDSGGEGGLLGLALHPSRRWLYAYHSTDDDNRVVRMRFDGRSLGRPEPVLTGIATATHHNGGGLRFSPDGMLFVSTGDAEDASRAPDTTSLNGKVLRITDRGGVPAGNPFDNAVWSFGHRNVEGLALDAKGRLWASEFGDKAYDELNRIVRGGDYGWPSVEGRDGAGGFRDPVAQWPTDDCSPSGIAIVGDHAFLGALQGECVWSVDLATGRSRRWLEGHGRIRLVAAAPDGSLWVGTSNRDGRGSPSDSDDRVFRVTL